MNFRTWSTAAAVSLFLTAVPAMAVTNSQRTQFDQEFARFDVNRDGVISRSEFPGDATLFARLDLNRDGVISRAETNTAMGNRRLLDEELRRLDTNRDGVISRSEWRGDLATFERLDRNDDGVLSQVDRQQARSGKSNRGNSRFKGMDRNGDGRITRREWRGNDTSFRQHDRNGDGILSRSEVQAGPKRKR